MICFAFLMTGILPAEAQRYKKNPDLDQTDEENEEPETLDSSKWRNFVRRLTFGGNFGASFGTATFVDLSPILGYKITENWQAGVGGTYMYLGYRPTKEGYSLYGGRVYSQYNVYKNLFAHVEYEALNVPDMRTGFTSRAWMNTPLFGGGYRSQIGRRSYFNITALYNLNWERNADIFPIYGSPLVLRVGFSL
ncbi:MAG: hypothetical protein ACXWEY_05250 [Bacteroidia bacterium]